jgi:hypothetical protein
METTTTTTTTTKKRYEREGEQEAPGVGMHFERKQSELLALAHHHTLIACLADGRRGGAGGRRGRRYL